MSDQHGEGGHSVTLDDNKGYYPIIIIGLTALITYLHFSFFQEQSPHVVFEELYYIPLLLGALRYGLKGAVITYVSVSALYLPFFFGNWTSSALGWVDRALHLLFTGAFTALAGFFVDRERRYRKQTEKNHYLAGIGQAATTIVHDLRNPLIAILGFGRRLQEGKGNTDTAVQVIMDSARSMERIVNDVLDFARPVRLELKEEDGRTIIKRVYDLCAAKAEEKGVSLSLDLPAEQAPIDGDGAQMQRALVNLVNNAIEASGTGQNVLLTAADEKNHLAVRIRDHGSGMGQEALDKLFTPFFTTKKGGTGLGMSIAKKIIEAHKGTIRIESKQGAGTTVMIDLPYKDKN